MHLTGQQCRMVALALRNEKALADEHARMLIREFGNEGLGREWFGNADLLDKLSQWFISNVEKGVNL